MFDTVDHRVSLGRLASKFGFTICLKMTCMCQDKSSIVNCSSSCMSGYSIVKPTDCMADHH